MAKGGVVKTIIQPALFFKPLTLMHLNEKKTSIRFDCNKILLDLSCQRGRSGRQGCHRGGLRLTREQVVVRYIGLPFFFVLIYEMK